MKSDSWKLMKTHNNLTRSRLSMLNPVNGVIHITIHHADSVHEVPRRQTKPFSDILACTHKHSSFTSAFPAHVCLDIFRATKTRNQVAVKPSPLQLKIQQPLRVARKTQFLTCLLLRYTWSCVAPLHTGFLVTLSKLTYSFLLSAVSINHALVMNNVHQNYFLTLSHKPLDDPCLLSSFKVKVGFVTAVWHCCLLPEYHQCSP